MKPKPRIRLIDHGIVLQDFSRFENSKEWLPVIAEARAFMAGRRPQSTLLLTDMSDSKFNQEAVDAMRALADHHRPYVKASAVVGLTPIMRVVYRALLTLTKREIKLCETRAQAIEWLASVNDPASAADASPKKP
jgi:hypothetical protein